LICEILFLVIKKSVDAISIKNDKRENIRIFLPKPKAKNPYILKKKTINKKKILYLQIQKKTPSRGGKREQIIRG